VVGILENPRFRAAFGRVEVFYLPINLKKDLLHQVLRLSVVVQDFEGDAEYQTIVAVEEHGQGILMAVPELMDQLFVRRGFLLEWCHKNSRRGEGVFVPA
jgi:hypothetical protein